jgi:Ca-activated chloride channel family protein
MMGKYEDAIRSYDQALVLRLAWREAEENRQVARIRLERLAPPESDHGGTGGMLSADEFVFDERGAKGTSPQTVEGGEPSEAEMRAVWLRRVQTQPADFLRSRFAYQLARQGEEDSP